MLHGVDAHRDGLYQRRRLIRPQQLHGDAETMIDGHLLTGDDIEFVIDQ